MGKVRRTGGGKGLSGRTETGGGRSAAEVLSLSVSGKVFSKTSTVVSVTV